MKNKILIAGGIDYLSQNVYHLNKKLLSILKKIISY